MKLVYFRLNHLTASSFAIATPVLTAILSRFSKYPLMLTLIAIAALISISLIAMVVYIMNSTMQLYFIDLAEQHFPSAKDLASS
ncbi:hypothetical protein [Paenibacillus guangzhouensis]|uniref:hypothetical protein n=1 Tax=Paenibacillus guangzhouensis TaxID=1473112 RepID=UPI001D10499F|nr:hypothetical protein [Paenibacillus guangzhouensis]